jgi:protein-tyrosine-phosphatase
MRCRAIVVGTVALIVALWSVQAAHARQAERSGVKTTVVFVCEHGAARSVIAAAYFNQIAAERHLPYHAVARGTSPQEDLSPATVKGLEADGMAFDRTKPKGLTEADAREAMRIVAFCPVPKAFSSLARATSTTTSRRSARTTATPETRSWRMSRSCSTSSTRDAEDAQRLEHVHSPRAGSFVRIRWWRCAESVE